VKIESGLGYKSSKVQV